jgi:GNAT superfamily N-acetyltransferase
LAALLGKPEAMRVSKMIAMDVTSDRQPIIRPAEGRDADAVFALARELAITFAVDRPGFDHGFAAIAAAPGTHLLVADLDGAVCGYLLGFVHPTFYANGPVAWVEELMVDETVRRRGVGAALMAAFEDEALADGARLVALATTRAAAFYTAIGYDRRAEYFRKHLGPH